MSMPVREVLSTLKSMTYIILHIFQGIVVSYFSYVKWKKKKKSLLAPKIEAKLGGLDF